MRPTVKSGSTFEARMSAPAGRLDYLVAILIVLFGCHARATGQIAPHEKEAAAAWEAFKSAKYEEAVRHADLCIGGFRISADRLEEDLEARKARVSNGRVSSKDKEAILKNGPLNDVAACFYIKGRSIDKLGKKDEATKILKETLKYGKARVWDARGWFWSPAEAAQLYMRNSELADTTPHEVYVANAWAALNQGENEKAIANADKCILELQETALAREEQLAKSNEHLPTGTVDEATKQRIFENGPLNDVAACLYIKGRSAEAIGDKPVAIKAYRSLAKLTQGRCWDPQGWFWSPAEQAAARLEDTALVK